MLRSLQPETYSRVKSCPLHTAMLPVMAMVLVVVLGGLVIVGHRLVQGTYQVHCNSRFRPYRWIHKQDYTQGQLRTAVDWLLKCIADACCQRTGQRMIHTWQLPIAVPYASTRVWLLLLLRVLLLL